MKKVGLVLMMILSTAVFSFAQDATKNINKTQAKQKIRIEEGKKSGEINEKEEKRLEKEQKEIKKNKKMAKADGVVTKEERKQIKKEQKKASHHIRHSKHDEDHKE